MIAARPWSVGGERLRRASVFWFVMTVLIVVRQAGILAGVAQTLAGLAVAVLRFRYGDMEPLLTPSRGWDGLLRVLAAGFVAGRLLDRLAAPRARLEAARRYDVTITARCGSGAEPVS